VDETQLRYRTDRRHRDHCGSFNGGRCVIDRLIGCVVGIRAGSVVTAAIPLDGKTPSKHFVPDLRCFVLVRNFYPDVRSSSPNETPPFVVV
jgi:hypothetical protein